MSDLKEIIQSPLFAKQKKKLHKNQLKDLDEAVKTIFENPEVGDLKVGDLQEIRVYKFKSLNNQILLAYGVDGHTLHLFAFGSHENFYRDFKKYLHQFDRVTVKSSFDNVAG